MPDVAAAGAILARFIHVGSACLLTGVFAFFVFVALPAIRAAGPAARARFEALDRRLLRLAAVALGAAIASGLVDLARQALVATGGDSVAGLAPRIVGILLTETRYGDIWLVRHALWLLLAALLLLREPERDRWDWLALRLGGLVLAVAGLAAGAASGHSASAPEPTTLAIAADVLHLLAAGIWAGALVPLALFLRWARPVGPDAPPAIAAVGAVRRFSTLGLVSVVVMLASGAYAVLQQVGSVPALLGTTYGRWLSVKLVLLMPLLGVALLNRAHLRPSLERAAGERDAGETEAGSLVARLSRFVVLEAVVVAAIFGAVAALSLTTPARHDPVAWPLPFRFTWATTEDLPDVWARVVIGSQLTAFGLVALFLALVFRRRWWRPVLVAGVAAVTLGLGVALPPLVVDAYPTTYVRPTVPYTAASIARGDTVYRAHCASCHGVGGAGDGPAAAGITPRPPDLTARHMADHTAGDLFWWLTHGIRGSAMPGFGDRLSPESRWDVVNFLRALAAAEQGRRLAPLVSPRSAIVAPDVSYTTGVGAERSLRDYRGQTIVLLVMFRLPESLERLSRLAGAYFDFRTLGAEILAVPLQEAGTVYRRLGPLPVVFPFVIKGAEQAAATYQLFRRDLSMEGRRPDPPMPVHMEMLVDRQGYLRARWIPAGPPDRSGGWTDVTELLREVERLAQEAPSAITPAEHVH